MRSFHIGSTSVPRILIRSGLNAIALTRMLKFLSHLMTAAYPIFRVLNAQINSGFSAKSFGQSLDPRPGSLFLMTEIYKMKGPGNGSGESFDRPLLMGNFALCDSIFICIFIHGGLYLFTIQGYHFKIGPMKVYCF